MAGSADEKKGNSKRQKKVIECMVADVKCGKNSSTEDVGLVSRWVIVRTRDDSDFIRWI